MRKTNYKSNLAKVCTSISLGVISSLAAAQSDSKDFYLDQASYQDKVVYDSDGEELNWKMSNKGGSSSTVESCDETNTATDASDECYQLNVAGLLGDKKWAKNKNYREVGRIVDDIEQQISQMGDGGTPYESGTPLGGIPSSFVPWWKDSVSQNISGQGNYLLQNIPSLIERAIVHSAQIQVFSDVPIIRETAIYEAKGDFDPIGYFDYRWTDIDDPVGSTLTTGGDGRFLENERLARLGIRKKFLSGGEVDFFSQSGVLNNNSEFLVPNNQATSRWSVTLTQPLLRGFGVKYNRSNIDIAKIDTSIAQDEFKRQIESHLLELVRAYWGLYLERASLLQKRKLVDSTEQLVEQLEKRSNFDATRAQLSRVQARLLDRKSDLVRSESAVRNAEAKIVALTNDPSMRIAPDFELIPTMHPSMGAQSYSADMAVALAMSNRPEIAQTFKQVKAGALRLDVTRSELKPKLNFIATYYRDGIEGERDRSGASSNALDEGGSWVAGLSLEYRFGNSVRKAAHRRKQAELRQLINQLRTTLETVILEVQVSVREVNTALRKMNAQYSILQSATLNLQALQKRQSVDADNGRNGSAYLESVLDLQEKLSEAEFGFLSSQITYNVSLSNLDRATGILLQSSELQPRRYENIDETFEDLPTYKIEKVRLK